MSGTLNVAAPRSEKEGARARARVRIKLPSRERKGERASGETYACVLRNIAAVMYVRGAVLPRVR